MGRCSLHDRLMEDCKECRLHAEVDRLRDEITSLRVRLASAEGRAEGYKQACADVGQRAGEQPPTGEVK